MKTIKIKEKTFQVLQELKKKEKAVSFDELITKIVVEPRVPNSMFGSLKGKIKKLPKNSQSQPTQRVGVFANFFASRPVISVFSNLPRQSLGVFNPDLKIKPFTRKEREEMWRDVNREI